MLILASQRIETVIGSWVLGGESEPVEENKTKRGSTPSIVEWLVLAWVSGKIVLY